MSQTPVDAEDRSDLGKYVAGWNALNTMLGRGGSFSGRERNCVFLNCGVIPGSGEPRFANVSGLSGFDFPDDARGLALVDWDHDGDLDLWVSNRTAPRLRFLSNTLDDGSRSVALLLEGDSCNRDAIGVRVTLSTSSGPLVRTLHAGDGYLSQSSKWLHFGLGSEPAIKSVDVHWPGGKTETFSGISAGGRFILEQGREEAEPWRRPGSVGELESAPNLAPESGAIAQVLLPRRIPTPRLEFRNSGESRQIEPGQKPLLVVLFASWCPNCQAEMKGLVARSEEIRAGGLDVLALAVDGLDEQGLGAPAEAAELLRQIKWPFDSGAATTATLSKLQHLTDALFEIRTPFAVPYSILLDPGRDLVAIYRGPIPPDTLRHDVASSADGIAVTRDLSVPFSGKWYTLHPGRPALLELLADHFQQRYPEDSVSFLEMALPQLAGDGAGVVRKRVGALHAGLGSRALAANRNSEAEAHFRTALEHGHESARLQHDFGVVLFNQRKFREAKTAFLRSLELAPGNPSATKNLESVRRALRSADSGAH